MSYLAQFMSGRYRHCLNYPIMILAVVLMMVLLAAYFSRGFGFDASEDTLLPEGDPALAYYRQVTRHLGGNEFLVLTYSPPTTELFSPSALDALAQLVERLQQVSGVSGVTSMLDAPLLKSPPVPLTELATGYKVLRSAGVDLTLARKELTESPLFSELLISRDGRATALRIELERNERLVALRDRRNRLRALEPPSEAQPQRLAEVERAYRAEYQHHRAQRDVTLNEIRQISEGLAPATSYIGGVPLVAADMVAYIKRDITVFGSAVVGLIALMLYLIFQRLQWVVLPLLSTAVSVLLTVGVLGFLRQPTTVISSNFISLLAIITISLSIHLIARYREIRAADPAKTQVAMVFEAMVDKFAPSIYTVLTTLVAFASLMTSEILPVKDFGWIMCVGILISFFVSYSFFAGLLLLVPKGRAGATLHHNPALIRFLGYFSIRHRGLVLAAAVISLLVAGLGISNLSLNNKLVEYFRSGTEVREGLQYIDQHFGGTIPLDIIVSFPPYFAPSLEEADDFATAETDSYPQRYWFTPDKIAYLADIEAYLYSLPAIGKVISLSTLEQIGRSLNDGKPLDALGLVAAVGAMPADLRAELLAPYASPAAGLMRISARIRETGPDFSHAELIREIEAYTRTLPGLAPDRVQVTGMAVLFNDMLKNLLESQTSTLGFVVAVTFLMFAVLLRSLQLALFGLLPNLLAAATVLGLMGFAGIPLDIMTITIAAIIIGIGVDDAIHYLHRFKHELRHSQNVQTAIRNSHRSIGSALYYTSLTVVIGFSVLTFSNFVPTVYFGLLTALAMVLALFANLTLLPALLLVGYKNGNGR